MAMFEPINWNELKGRLLDGRYRLDAPIAEGGFGVVFEGTHLGLNTKVAVKMLRYPLASTAAQRQQALSQFVAEGQLLAKLRHPSIVSALDVGTFDVNGERHAFLVLEWCGARDLHDDLRTRRGRGGRSVASAWRLLSPICDALAHAHAAGCVHRDVKPANVMLIEGGATKLIDFGIAKEAPVGEEVGSGATRTQSAHRAFSLHYAAPEQLAGSKTGPWTDVHALGLLFTELLVDSPPYGEGDVPLAVIDANRPTPAAFGVDVGAWEPILRRAVSAKPADRQRDAAALRDELEQALADASRVQARAPALVPLRAAPSPPPDAVTRKAEGTVLTTSASMSLALATPAPGGLSISEREVSSSRTTMGGTRSRRYWPLAIGATLLLGVVAVVARNVPSAQSSLPSAVAAAPTETPTEMPPARAKASPPTQTERVVETALIASARSENDRPAPKVTIATASARRPAVGAKATARPAPSASIAEAAPPIAGRTKETLY
jgi:serine/threonine protein kinase